MKEPDYDNLNIVRMAIVERDDHLVVLMPPGTTPAEADGFAERVEALGWPRGRIMVLSGPEAFAVLKPSEDEGQGGEEQPESDQVDLGPEGAAEGRDSEADGCQDPEQQINSEGHTQPDTRLGYCSHGIDWKSMSFTHWAIQHKTDHP